MARAKELALLLVIVVTALVMHAQPLSAGMVLSAQDQVRPLAGQWSALRDPDGTLDIADVSRSGAGAGFKPISGDLVAGYDRAAWWLRTDLRRSTDAPAEWLLEVEPAYLDRVSLFVEDEGGRLRAFNAGDHLPFASRAVPYRTFVFRLHLGDDLPHRLYLRVASSSSITVSARVLSPEGMSLSIARRDLAQGLAHGAAIIVILFALVQFAAGRDRLYLGFLAYAVPLEVMYLCISGLASQYLFPSMPELADPVLGACTCLAIGGGILFAARILDFDQYFPRMGRIYTFAGRGCQLGALSVLVGLYGVVAPAVLSLVLVSFFITTVLALRRAAGGDVAARWYLAAFLVQILVNMAVVSRVLGLAESSLDLDLAAHFAAGAHTLLIACGLIWRGAGMEAHRHRLRQSQLASAHQIERALEERVRQRTLELAESNAVLAREIAERRLAEQRIGERERQVRAILHAAPFPMVVSSFPEGVIQYLNAPASELLNVPQDDAIGLMTAGFYVDPSERGAMIDNLRQNGAILGTELRIRRLPYEQRWVLLSAVRFEYGGQDCVLICLNDISTRKQLEAMLRLSSRRAETALEAERQAVREQRNFMAMVSHEFRVPLAIIEAASQLMRIYVQGNEEAEDEVGKVRRAVRRMSELIDVCLADDRLDADSMQLQTDRVDVARMLAELCDDKRPFAGERDIILEASGPAEVTGDATLLRIAFSNLIENALKFSPPTAPVTISLEQDADCVKVRVSDKGLGISIDEQPRIFEKFYRSTKSDRVRGAGLGLYIVKRIMDLHGAAISLNSERGVGSSFDIWLSRDCAFQPK